MKIKVLGPGRARCQQLEKTTKEVVCPTSFVETEDWALE